VRTLRANLLASDSHGSGAESAPDAAAAPASALSGTLSADGAVRRWRITHGSWEDSPLPSKIAVAAGQPLSLPFRPLGSSGSSSSTPARLLQLGAASRSDLSVFEITVVSDLTASHVQFESPAAAAADGSSGTGSVVIHGLQPGAYRLLLPDAALGDSDSQSCGQSDPWAGESSSVLTIEVLPPAPFAAAGGGAAAAGAAGGAADLLRSDEERGGVELVTPSQREPLRISHAAVSAAAGVEVELRGSEEAMAAVRVGVVLSRYALWGVWRLWFRGEGALKNSSEQQTNQARTSSIHSTHPSTQPTTCHSHHHQVHPRRHHR